MKTATAIPAERKNALLDDVMELVKARLSFLVLITTLVGFLVGWRGPINWVLLTATLLGTALCAAGASALNQWWERDADSLMRRTRNRPLAAGRMAAQDGFLAGLFLSATGVAILALFTNHRAALLALATIGIYILVYTPLKKISPLNTLVGAIPGALPPLIGWIAARSHFSLEGCLLFAILWFWQMPHFLAIAWMYREDYAAGGFSMITSRDPEGRTTSRQAVLYSCFLLLVTLLPALLGFNNQWFLLGAVILGGALTTFAVRFAIQRDRPSARALFLFSILHLPLLLGLLVATRQ
jgi:heme o synthase